MNKVEKILVAIAGTESSYFAGLYAIYLSGLLNADLFGIYVINEKALNDLLKVRIFIAEEKIDYEKEMEEDAHRYLSQLSNLAEKKNIYLKGKIIKKGVVHREIITTAEEIDADLIIIGELKRIVSLRDIVYDEMERLLRESNIPILIAKNKEKIEMLYNNI